MSIKVTSSQKYIRSQNHYLYHFKIQMGNGLFLNDAFALSCELEKLLGHSEALLDCLKFAAAGQKRLMYRCQECLDVLTARLGGNIDGFEFLLNSGKHIKSCKNQAQDLYYSNYKLKEMTIETARRNVIKTQQLQDIEQQLENCAFNFISNVIP